MKSIESQIRDYLIKQESSRAFYDRDQLLIKFGSIDAEKMSETELGCICYKINGVMSERLGGIIVKMKDGLSKEICVKSISKYMSFL